MLSKPNDSGKLPPERREKWCTIYRDPAMVQNFAVKPKIQIPDYQVFMNVHGVHGREHEH